MKKSVRAIDWPWLVRLAPRVVMLGALGGWAIAVMAGPGAAGSSQPWGGDYPAFQMAGKIALDGRYDRLYDFDFQNRYQEGMPRDGLLPYMYPPIVAALYAPLATLPYRTAYALYTLLSLAALAASVLLLKPLSATIRADTWRALALVLLFYPVWRSTLGGQNTSFSLLILCGTWRLLHSDREFLAGVVLGLLSYKPQLLVPIAGVAFLAGRLRASLGVLLSTAGLFLASVALAGWHWPVDWVHAVQMYANADRQFNLSTSISLGQITDLFGWPNGWIPLSGALSLWVAWIAYSKGRSDVFAVLAIGITASLLIPPHAMFYDVGIALPALLLLADRGYTRSAALLWLGGAGQSLAWLLPASPVIAVLAGTLVVLRRAIRD